MKILVVDDNATNRKLLRVTLASAGHEVEEAEDGVEALEKIRGDGFDAVISDVLMPRMDGYRLCYELRRSTSHRDLPVLLYTATYTSPSDETLARRVGADRFIQKPAAWREILQSLNEVSVVPGRHGRPEPPHGELDILREYSESLVRKLEEKNLELEAKHEELCRSEEQYQLCFKSSPVPMWVVDRETLLYVAVNDAAVAHFGYSREEFLSMTIEQIRPPEDVAAGKRTVPKDESGLQSMGVWRYVKKDGTVAQVEITAQVLTFAGRAGWVALAYDVTDRLSAEDALRQSERRFSAAFHASPAATVLSDLETGRILAVNEQFLKVTGYSKEETIGSIPLELRLWAEEADRERLGRDLLAGRPVRDQEVRIRTKSGEIRDVIGSLERVEIGTSTAVLSTFNDITERHRAEEATRRSEERLRLLLDSTAEAIYGLDLRGNCTFSNPACARLLGYSSPEDLLGRNMHALAHHTRADGSSLHESDCRIFQSFYRGEGTHGDDEVLWRADGTSFFAEYWSYPVRRDGELVGAVVTFLDITERKHAEDLARTSEQRVRALMEHANDAIFISSTEGVVLEVNRAAEALQGLRREDMIGCPVAELVPAEERERVGRSFGKIISGGRLKGFETFSIRPDGTRVPVEVSASLVEVGGARVVNAIVRDVSERRRAEERLRGSEERYRLLFENNPQQMWVFDEETFAFLAVNDAACRHYGYSREEFLAMTIRDIRPSEDAPKLLRLLESEPDEFRKSGVWRHRRKDGSLIDVEISSHPLVFDRRPAQLVLTTDVTERLRAEREKRESEERYRVIFDASPLPMWLYDTPSLEIRAVNQAAIDLYGYARKEFLGMTLYDLRSPEEAERLRTMFADIPEPTGRWDKGVWVHRKKDGTPMDIDSHTHEVVVGGRRMRLSVQIDVTHQRRLEGQLRQSQKMEAIGQLAGGVAHDFNNLLTAILGYSDLLATEVGEKSPLLESIDEIRKAGERAASLTRQLLAFSRRQVLEPKVLDLNALIVNLEKMLRRLIGEDVELLTVLGPAIGRVRADAGQIEQVLLNLAVNARDAMPKGGRVTIETQDVDLDEAYAREHVTVRPGRYVMFALTDTGAGMTTKTKAHMFEPFFTTKGQGKGTGLGLATVYGIVKQSSGYVWVYSELGRGTTFKVYLPRVEGTVEAIAARRPTSATLRGTENVLLVEDDQSVRTLTRIILETNGYTVLDAGGIEEALKIARDHSGPIQLLLTDVVMPEMGGSDLAARVLALRPETRVIYMSGYTDDAVVRHGLVAEGLSFLQKPFTPEALALKVRQVLDAADST